MKKILYEFNTAQDNYASFYHYNDNLYDDNIDKINLIKNKIKYIIDIELTEKERNVINLYYNKNLTIPQISDILNKDKSTVSRNLNRAKNKIREYSKYLF